MKNSNCSKNVGKLQYHCLVCGNKVSKTSKMINGGYFQEIGRAIVFSSNGNYASGMWDPIDDRLHMEIAICDKCLSARTKYAHVVCGHRRYIEHTRELFQKWVSDTQTYLKRRKRKEGAMS